MSGPTVTTDKLSYAPGETVKIAVDPGTNHPFTSTATIDGVVHYADGVNGDLSGTISIRGRVDLVVDGYTVVPDPATADGLHFIATPAV